MHFGIEILSRIPHENRREFIQSFKLMTQFEGCNDNCIYHKLFEDVGESNHFLWIEHWTDPNILEQYIQSDRFKTILGAIEALGEFIYLNRIEIKKNTQNLEDER